MYKRDERAKCAISAGCSRRPGLSPAGVVPGGQITTPSMTSVCFCACNVLVGEDPDDKVHVNLMGPQSIPSRDAHPSRAPLAEQLKSRLEHVVEAL